MWKESPEEKARLEEEKKEKQPKAVAVDLGGLIFGGNAGGDKPAGTSSNPFSTTTSSNPFASTPSSNPFAPSTASPLNPFAAAPPPPSAEPPVIGEIPQEEEIRTQTTSSWESGPSYPPQYITTSYEPSSPKISAKSLPPMANLKITDPLSDDPDLSDDESPVNHRSGKGAGGRTKKGSGGGQGRADGSGGKGGSGGGGTGLGEGYEVQKVKGVDEVFLRFQERVSREGLQVIRYSFIRPYHLLCVFRIVLMVTS